MYDGTLVCNACITFLMSSSLKGLADEWVAEESSVIYVEFQRQSKPMGTNLWPFSLNDSFLAIGRVNRQGRGFVKNCKGCALGPEKGS